MQNQISPERRLAYQQFVLGVPRVCSPTLCGILPLIDCVADVSMDSLSNNVTVQSEHSWNIDDLATLYGKEFSNVHELEQFNKFEQETFEADIIKKNEDFFSQSIINASPLVKKSRWTICSSSPDGQRPRKTGSFIRMIDKVIESTRLAYCKYDDISDTNTSTCLSSPISSMDIDCTPSKCFPTLVEQQSTPTFFDSDFESFEGVCLNKKETKNCSPIQMSLRINKTHKPICSDNFASFPFDIVDISPIVACTSRHSSPKVESKFSKRKTPTASCFTPVSMEISASSKLSQRKMSFEFQTPQLRARNIRGKLLFTDT